MAGRCSPEKQIGDSGSHQNRLPTENSQSEKYSTALAMDVKRGPWRGQGVRPWDLQLAMRSAAAVGGGAAFLGTLVRSACGREGF